jgi:hypothetical protein
VLREIACDRLAARHLGDARVYRRALAWWGTAALVHRANAGSVALLRGRHPLLERLDLLDHLDLGRPEAGRGRRLTVLATALTAAACFPAIHPPTPLVVPSAAVPGCLSERFVVLAELARLRATDVPLETDSAAPRRD